MPACCASATALPDTLSNVKKYYGEVLQTSKDLKTSACTAAGKPHNEIIKIMMDVPKEVKAKFYGCGAPLPLGIDGLRVLDLGSGSGRDCYIASKLVGEKGARSPVSKPPARLHSNTGLHTTVRAVADGLTVMLG